MFNFEERLRTLRTGLSVRLISRLRSIRCASLEGYRLLFLHGPLFSHPKFSTQAKKWTENVLFLHHILWFFPGDVFLLRCHGSRITARSRDVLTLLCSFVVTAPHHHCSVANMVWDPLASVGRVLTIWGSGSRRKLH